MNKMCALTQDLLPLYEEQLLSPDSQQIVEQHLQSCPNCRQIAEQSKIPLPTKVAPQPSAKKTIRNITIRLTTIQIIFVVIAFILALSSVITNDNRIFILTYTLLGAATFLFYRSIIMPILIVSIPTFICVCVKYMTNLLGSYYEETFLEGLSVAIFAFIVYMFFACIGIVIGYCIHKFKEVKS